VTQQVSDEEQTERPSGDAEEAGQAMRLPDLTYTEQETELRSAVRSVLDDRAPFDAVLARTESAQTYDCLLWKTLAADIGCAGLLGLDLCLPAHLGRSFHGLSLSSRISGGSPSTRSATMLRRISDVPPSIEFAFDRRKR